MTDPVMVALIAAVPATIAAVVGVVNTRKANEIHVLVNSNLTKVKSDLSEAIKQIARLEKLLAARDEPAGDY